MPGGRLAGNRRQSPAAPRGAHTGRVAAGARRRSAVTCPLNPRSVRRSIIARPPARSLARSIHRSPAERAPTYAHSHEEHAHTPSGTEEGGTEQNGQTNAPGGNARGAGTQSYALSVAEHLKALSQRWASEHRGRGRAEEGDGAASLAIPSP